MYQKMFFGELQYIPQVCSAQHFEKTWIINWTSKTPSENFKKKSLLNDYHVTRSKNKIAFFTFYVYSFSYHVASLWFVIEVFKKCWPYHTTTTKWWRVPMVTPITPYMPDPGCHYNGSSHDELPLLFLSTSLSNFVVSLPISRSGSLLL